MPRPHGREPGNDASNQANRDLDRLLRRAAIRAWLVRSLFALALVIVAQHLIAHAGWQPIPISMGYQDIFIGYPMGMVVGIVGLMSWGATPRRR